MVLSKEYSRDEILDYWGKDYFDDLDLNDYIDFAERVVSKNSFVPGGLVFGKASEAEEKAWDEEDRKYFEGLKNG